MWSFHDRMYKFCKSLLFSNSEWLTFEFFRFFNWEKALKSVLYMDITRKAVKIHNFGAKITKKPTKQNNQKIQVSSYLWERKQGMHQGGRAFQGLVISI